jgi:hypothetical protein
VSAELKLRTVKDLEDELEELRYKHPLVNKMLALFRMQKCSRNEALLMLSIELAKENIELQGRLLNRLQKRLVMFDEHAEMPPFECFAEDGAALMRCQACEEAKLDVLCVELPGRGLTYACESCGRRESNPPPEEAA